MSRQQYFGEVDREWDKTSSSFYSEAVMQRAISGADVQPGKLAADIGAGTAFLSEGLLQNGLRVTAID